MNLQRRWQIVAGLLVAALAMFGLNFPQIHGWEVGFVVLAGLLFASGVSIPMPYWWAAIPGVIFLVRGFESSRVNGRIGPLLIVGLFLIVGAAKSPRETNAGAKGTEGPDGQGSQPPPTWKENSLARLKGKASETIIEGQGAPSCARCSLTSSLLLAIKTKLGIPLR